jgi:6-phosphofructokinase 1
MAAVLTTFWENDFMPLPLSSPQLTTTNIKKIAILFSGGPAPSANSVIGSAALCFARAGIEVYGMLNGYTHLENYKEGDKLEEDAAYVRLDKNISEGLRSARGIVIGTARANPGKPLKHPEDLKDAKKREPLTNVYYALRSLGVDALISIGGDDTLTTAAKFQLIQKELPPNEPRIKVVHLPKTIDNDYQGIDFTFGYFTAVEFLAAELRNLLADSEATNTGYICQLMGRKAAWLAYGAMIASEASMVIGLEDIPPEWEMTEESRDPATNEVIRNEDGTPLMRKVINIKKLVDRCVDVLIARETEGKKSFVAAISEGIAEYLPLSEIEMCLSRDEYVSLKPDSFGHFPVSQLKYTSRLGRLIADEYQKRIGKSRKMVGLQFGYECRCHTPTAFDIILGSQLGVGAYRALCEAEKDAVMISVTGNLELVFAPFEDLIDFSILRAYQRPVTVGSDFHQLARYIEAWVK